MKSSYIWVSGGGQDRGPACHDGEMAYDEGLATRVRDLVGGEPGLTEKKMFGGLAMLLDGTMTCGVHGAELIVRTDPAEHEAQLAEPGAHPFDVGGRQMKGWLLVAAYGCEQDTDLRRWVDRGVSYARTLPPK